MPVRRVAVPQAQVTFPIGSHARLLLIRKLYSLLWTNFNHVWHWMVYFVPTCR